MDSKTVDQIHLCLNELQMIKQLLDLKVADDFCSRLLGIYVMMRVDDITKIWSHQIPKANMDRHLVDGVKNQYNQGLRTVRDKLGAHYQTPNGKDDLFGSLQIFKSIDYANTTCMIDAIMEVEGKIEGKIMAVDGFRVVNDLDAAKEALAMLYSDDKAYLTNGALDVFGMNKGSIIACSGPQVKGQYLRSIELMVEAAQRLLERKYIAMDVERMFKRLFVSMVYNYHDNLITRNDIKDSAVQYEEGFDVQFKNLINVNDDKAILETAFNKFETIYQVEPVIRKYRDTRNKACAHLDEASIVEDINKLLDAVNVAELSKAYRDMLNMFNFICRNVFLLRIIAMPTRVPIHGSRFVTLENNENFYGEEIEAELPNEMTCTEIMRSIRKKDERYDEARDALGKKLMSRDEYVYNEVIEAITQRLQEGTVAEDEMLTIIQLLGNGAKGYPRRLQRTLIEMLSNENIFRNHGGHLIWLLPSICKDDDEIDMPQILDNIIANGSLIPTAFAILSLLHLLVDKDHSCIVVNNKAHDIPDGFKKYCDGVKHPTERLAMMLMLSQHWFYGQEFNAYRSYENKYSDYFKAESTNALEDYLIYIKCKDKDEIKICENYLETFHYILLLNRLVIIEKERNQNSNIFLDMWRYNCYVMLRTDVYEALAVGIMFELDNKIKVAKEILETIAAEYPINDCALKMLEEFYERHPNVAQNPSI